MNNTYDVIVIGGGPGGYVAAIHASKMGMRVGLIEKNNLGGTCLHWGCIPTKSLLSIAEGYSFIKNDAKEFGIDTSLAEIDIKKAVVFSRNAANTLCNGIKHLMKKNNIEVYNEKAIIAKDKSIILSNNTSLKAKNIVIATGSRQREINGLNADGNLIWNARHAMTPEKIPKSIVIIGSGAIGMEFASFYNSLGTKVHIVEMADRVLPMEDEEISAIIAKSFSAKGITLYTKSKFLSFNKAAKGAMVKIADSKNKEVSIDVDNVIVAAGVVGNSDSVGLHNFSSIKIENSWISVNNVFETGERGIYAIGDVIGAPCLAHKASHEGVLVMNHISGKKIKRNLDIPSCIYSKPQVASIGMTEYTALSNNHQIRIGRSSGVSNGKSVAIGKQNSFVKIIIEKNTDEILGAHMIGSEVTEMIHSIAIARKLEATGDFLKEVIFPHPTVSEMIYEALLDAYGCAIHS